MTLSEGTGTMEMFAVHPSEDDPFPAVVIFMDDTKALLAFLDENQPVKRGGMGSIGYCMCGRHVFRAAAHFPDRFQASASLHGTELVTDSKDSPHLAKTIIGELYCGFGENDRHTPDATIDAIDRAMRSRDARYRREIHKNAEHGYALPDRHVYDKAAANCDWERIFAMFQRRIPRHS